MSGGLLWIDPFASVSVVRSSTSSCTLWTVLFPGTVNWLIDCIGESKQAARPFAKQPNLSHPQWRGPVQRRAGKSLAFASFRFNS